MEDEVRTNLRALGTTQYMLLELVGLTRFELVTPRLSSVCSNQLSYRPRYSRILSKNPPYKWRGPVPSKLDRRAIHSTLKARSIIECLESRWPRQLAFRLAWRLLALRESL